MLSGEEQPIQMFNCIDRSRKRITLVIQTFAGLNISLFMNKVMYRYSWTFLLRLEPLVIYLQ